MVVIDTFDIRRLVIRSRCLYFTCFNHVYVKCSPSFKCDILLCLILCRILFFAVNWQLFRWLTHHLIYWFFYSWQFIWSFSFNLCFMQLILRLYIALLLFLLLEQNTKSMSVRWILDWISCKRNLTCTRWYHVNLFFDRVLSNFVLFIWCVIVYTKHN